MLDSLDTLISFVLIMLIVSMLITVSVQLISSALNLRGRNLARGLTETLTVVCPGLEGKSRAFAEHLLQGPMLSDSASRLTSVSRLATAVRPDEVFDAIHRIATGQHAKGTLSQAQIDDLSGNARELLEALGVPGAVFTNAGQSVQDASQAMKDAQTSALLAISTLPPDQKTPIEKALTDFSDKVAGYTSHFAAIAANDVQGAAGTIDRAYQKFEYWFGISQDRAQGWFTSHTRRVTVILAFIAAFALQLDTVEIYKTLSTDKPLRDKLIAEIPSVTADTQRILTSGTSVLQQAVNDVAKQANAAAKLKLQALSVLPTYTRQDVRTLVQNAVGSSDTASMEAFDVAVDKDAETTVEASASNYSALRASLDSSGFQLFPNNISRWPGEYWDHTLGMLFTVALLSLGAPFWFNALQSLASLRSSVADAIDNDPQPAAAGPPKPPPTVTPPTAPVP